MTSTFPVVLTSAWGGMLIGLTGYWAHLLVHGALHWREFPPNFAPFFHPLFWPMLAVMERWPVWVAVIAAVFLLVALWLGPSVWVNWLHANRGRFVLGAGIVYLASMLPLFALYAGHKV